MSPSAQDGGKAGEQLVEGRSVARSSLFEQFPGGLGSRASRVHARLVVLWGIHGASQSQWVAGMYRTRFPGHTFVLCRLA